MVNRVAKGRRWIYWTPRILSIVFVLFLALFSLDVFEICFGFSQCALGLLIHNIPAIVLAVIVCISWKKEIVGAIGFFLAGLAYIGLVINTMINNGFEWYYLSWIIQISGIAIFVGVLFLIGWKRKK